jgi:hypothetical protein
VCDGIRSRLLFDALHDEHLDPRALSRGELAVEFALEFLQDDLARQDRFAVICKDVIDGGCVSGAFSRSKADARG